jgi:hypothetical protein
MKGRLNMLLQAHWRYVHYPRQSEFVEQSQDGSPEALEPWAERMREFFGGEQTPVGMELVIVDSGSPLFKTGVVPVDDWHG